MAAFPSSVYKAARFRKVFEALAAGKRVDFWDDGDSNQQQDTRHGHWVNSLRLWSSRHGQWATRMQSGGTGVGASSANTATGGIPGYVVDSFPEGACDTSAIPPTLAMATTNTDGANGPNIMRFDQGGVWRVRPATLSPSASNISGLAPMSVSLPVLDALAPDLNLVAGGGVAAYSFFIPFTSGGTINMDVRVVGGSWTSLGSATHSTKMDQVQDGVIQFAALAENLPRLIQPNRIFTNQSSGEFFSWGYRIMRAGVTSRSGGPGGVAWNRRWCNGGQALAHMAHDLRAQSDTALGELARQSYRFADYVVFRLKHMGNDTAASGIGSVDANGTITGVASNTKAGFKNNFRYWAKRTYESAVAAGVPADRIILWAGAYHARTPGSGYDIQQDYAAAQREVADESDPWCQAIVVSDGWGMRSFAEMIGLGWSADGAHLTAAGFDGFAADEYDSLKAAAVGGQSARKADMSALGIGL